MSLQKKRKTPEFFFFFAENSDFFSFFLFFEGFFLGLQKGKKLGVKIKKECILKR